MSAINSEMEVAHPQRTRRAGISSSPSQSSEVSLRDRAEELTSVYQYHVPRRHAERVKTGRGTGISSTSDGMKLTLPGIS